MNNQIIKTTKRETEKSEDPQCSAEFDHVFSSFAGIYRGRIKGRQEVKKVFQKIIGKINDEINRIDREGEKDKAQNCTINGCV